MKNSIHTSEWLKAIEQVNAAPPIPKDWLSRLQIQEKIGLKSTTTKDYIRKLIDAGLVELQTFQCQDRMGHTRYEPRYRLKPKASLKRRPN